MTNGYYPITSDFVRQLAELWGRGRGTYTPLPHAIREHPQMQKNGRYYRVAGEILAELINWHLPVEKDGELRQRFPGSRFEVRIPVLARRVGASESTVRRALRFLEGQGFIRLEAEPRRFPDGTLRGKRLFVRLNTGMILEMLFPKDRTVKMTVRSSLLSTPNGHFDTTERSFCTDRTVKMTVRHGGALKGTLTKKLKDKKTQSHPPALKNIKAAGGGKLSEQTQTNFSHQNHPAPSHTKGPEKASAPDKISHPEPERETTKRQPSTKAEGDLTPEEGVLRQLGVPRRYRQEIMKALREGRLTLDDFIAELARCYHDAREGTIRRPVVAAAANLVRGDRAPREFYDPAVWAELPEPVWDVLARAGWIPEDADVREADAEDEDPFDVLMEMAVNVGNDGPEAPEGRSNSPPDGDSQARNLWKKVLQQFQQEMSPTSFNTWVRPSRAVAFDGQTLTIAAPNAYAREWLESRLTNGLKRKLLGLLGRRVEVRFVVESETLRSPGMGALLPHHRQPER